MEEKVRSVKVVLTDHPWPDVEIERAIIERAGMELVVGAAEVAREEDIRALIAAADPVAIMTCWAPVSSASIASPTALRIVARIGVGLDNIDVAGASARGTWVTNVPDYCVEEVSDHAVALALASERGVCRLDRAVRAQGWHLPAFVPRRMRDLVVGVVGLGRIGQAVARKFGALGCPVIAVSPRAASAPSGVELVSLAALQARADIIVLTVPLNAQTTHMVDAAFIGQCERKPLLINVSRGGLVDSDALLAGLAHGALRGAALDVVEGEPAPPEAVLDHPDIVVTPHVGYLSDASLHELRSRACNEVVRVLAGMAPEQPCNSPDHGGARPLPGGVSSDIRLTNGPEGEIVVKQALSKLKVAADWRSDPARAATEVRAIEVAGALLGRDAVPQILWFKPEAHAFAMRRVDSRLHNWKETLLAGHIDADTARRAGSLLGQLHGRSASTAGVAEKFADLTFFEELRIVPFFTHTAERLPHLAQEIGAAAARLVQVRSALVHGDYSPKNMLADGADVVVLDFEVAHWGNPQFDVAFCISHLMLKAERSMRDAAALQNAARLFLDAYREAEGIAADDGHLSRLIGCLILARTDGDSPVDYLNELDVEHARALGERMLVRPPPSVAAYLVEQGEIA